MHAKKELVSQTAEKDEVIKRLTRQLEEKQEAVKKAFEKAETEASQAQVADQKALVSLEGELGLPPFPNEDPETGVFVEPLAVRVPRLGEAARRLLDSATDAEFSHFFYFVERFLRCCYQVEVLQKTLAELDGSLTDELSDEELLRAGYQHRLLGENFPYEAVLEEYMLEKAKNDHVDDPSS